jgi:hypothetical protein
MADTHSYKIKIKIVSPKGYYSAGHKVGEEWLIPSGKTPEGIRQIGLTVCRALPGLCVKYLFSEIGLF